jgi:hypothetical protein
MMFRKVMILTSVFTVAISMKRRRDSAEREIQPDEFRVSRKKLCARTGTHMPGKRKSDTAWDPRETKRLKLDTNLEWATVGYAYTKVQDATAELRKMIDSPPEYPKQYKELFNEMRDAKDVLEDQHSTDRGTSDGECDKFVFQGIAFNALSLSDSQRTSIEGLLKRFGELRKAFQNRVTFELPTIRANEVPVRPSDAWIAGDACRKLQDATAELHKMIWETDSPPEYPKQYTELFYEMRDAKDDLEDQHSTDRGTSDFQMTDNEGSSGDYDPFWKLKVLSLSETQRIQGLLDRLDDLKYKSMMDTFNGIGIRRRLVKANRDQDV